MLDPFHKILIGLKNSYCSVTSFLSLTPSTMHYSDVCGDANINKPRLPVYEGIVQTIMLHFIMFVFYYNKRYLFILTVLY